MELSTSRRADELSIWTEPRPKLDGHSILDEVFNRFDGSYPGTWKSKFSSPISIQNWKNELERTLVRRGVTLQQMARGLDSYQEAHKGWPPSVEEFVDACQPPVDPVAAYHEAVAGLEARGRGEVGAWSHPAVYWAASKLSRDLMSMPSAQVRERWTATLKAQLARGEWEAIPGPRLQLPAPGASMLSKEDAAKMLAEIGASGILRKPSNFDHMRWARVILERQAAGDPQLTIVQIKAARDALGFARANSEGGAT